MESSKSNIHFNEVSVNDINEVEHNLVMKERKDDDATVVIEDVARKQLIYGVSDSPPIHVTIICGLQVGSQT